MAALGVIGGLFKSRPVVSAKYFTTHLHPSEPITPLPKRKAKWVSAREAVEVVKSGNDVFVHGFAATPIPLMNALCDHAMDKGLKHVKLHHIGLKGEAKWVKPEYAEVLRSNSFFITENHRQAVNEGRADFVPVFLSESQQIFRRDVIKLDVAMVQLSPPDKRGFCSLGTSVDCTRAAVQHASYVIGLVNKHMPRTFGDTVVHTSHLDAIVESDFELPELAAKEPSPEEAKVGKLISDNLIANGATLQMGIGSIPGAAMRGLQNHKDLGVHTEMLSDGVLPLVEKGVINNTQKIVRPGKIVATFCNGTKKLFDFLDDNPLVVMGDVAWVNDATIIRQNPKVTAINSCIEIDITGQVVSDSIGTRMFSGVGGQIDYLRGASLGFDMEGKPILALTSTTKSGESKIVPFIKRGAGVVTSRAHVHYVVTEHGIAYLFGKNLRQRAYELIKIAHPNHRKDLEKAAFERLKCMPSPD